MPTSDEEASQVLHELHRLADVYSIAEIDPDYWQKLCLLSVRERIEERKPKKRGRRKGDRKAWKDFTVCCDFIGRMQNAKPGTKESEVIEQMERDGFYRQGAMKKGAGTIRRIIYRYKNHPEAVREMCENSERFIEWVRTEGKTLLGSKI